MKIKIRLVCSPIQNQLRALIIHLAVADVRAQPFFNPCASLQLITVGWEKLLFGARTRYHIARDVVFFQCVCPITECLSNWKTTPTTHICSYKCYVKHIWFHLYTLRMRRLTHVSILCIYSRSGNEYCYGTPYRYMLSTKKRKEKEFLIRYKHVQW